MTDHRTSQDRAEQLAASDVATVAESVRAVLASTDLTACIVDGSAYSPSTRAMSGGQEAYEADDTGDLQEAYLWALDEGMDALADSLGVSLYWEDGCLWMERAEQGDDAPLPLPEQG